MGNSSELLKLFYFRKALSKLETCICIYTPVTVWLEPPGHRERLKKRNKHTAEKEKT